MAKVLKILTGLGIAALSMVTGSCRDSVPSAHVLSGNMSYSRGQYQKSILQYFAADDVMSAGNDIVYHNLANVYYALGEGDAALRTWSLAEESTDNIEVLFRIAFNRGVLYYNRGHYDEAYRSFRAALKLNPADIDTKINLEESLLRIPSTIPQNSPAPNPPEGEKSRSSRHLLDYVQRKEADAWSEQPDVYQDTVEDW
jgi:Ca-activated chloride channel family protein